MSEKNYNTPVEEEKKRRENVLFNMRSTADEHISDFSCYMVDEIKAESDPHKAHAKMIAWVKGLISLHSKKDGL